MRLAVVAFPVLSAADRAAIDEIRTAHDPNAARIAPHFTLVFPTASIGAEALGTRVAAGAVGQKPLGFVLRRVVMHPEPESAYVFLVPDEGHADLSALHARLNPERRDDPSAPAFVPHITIARFADEKQAAALTSALQARSCAIEGRIEALSLVEVPEAGRVCVRREIALHAAR